MLGKALFGLSLVMNSERMWWNHGLVKFCLVGKMEKT